MSCPKGGGGGGGGGCYRLVVSCPGVRHIILSSIDVYNF